MSTSTNGSSIVVNYLATPVRDGPVHLPGLELDRREVAVIDATLLVPDPGLDGSGFRVVELAPAASADASQLAAAAVDLVRRELQAIDCVAYATRLSGGQAAAELQLPSRMVYGDAYRDLQRHIASSDQWGSAAPANDHFAILRLTVPEPQGGLELALIHGQTIRERDIISIPHPEFRQERRLLSACYSPAHVWFHFRDLPPGRALLRKVWDSRIDGRSRRTLGCALDASARSHAEVLLMVRLPK